MGLSGLFGLGKKTRTETTSLVDPARYTPVLAVPITAPGPKSGSRRRPPGALVLGTAVPRKEPGPPEPPPTVGKSLSDADVKARQAAMRTRRRAAAGSVPSRSRPTGTVLTPILQPKTLLGY